MCYILMKVLTCVSGRDRINFRAGYSARTFRRVLPRISLVIGCRICSGIRVRFTIWNSGISLIYSCLFIKTWTLYTIWRLAKQFKRSDLTTLSILCRIGVCVGVEVVSYVNRSFRGYWLTCLDFLNYLDRSRSPSSNCFQYLLLPSL